MQVLNVLKTKRVKKLSIRLLVSTFENCQVKFASTIMKYVLSTLNWIYEIEIGLEHNFNNYLQIASKF